MAPFDRMPISPFTASSASSAGFPPRTPLSPFRRPTLPSSPMAPSPSTTSLMGGRLVLPRLPRRVIYLAAFLTVLIYTTAAFRVTGDVVSDKLAAVALIRPPPIPQGGRVRDEEVDDWLQETVDGSVLVKKNGGKGKGHPIRQLMLEARQKWDSQLARQSRTLEEAISNYRSRYGRAPPKGFDAWWKFAKANNIVIVDDYDQIHTSITPFLALDPVLLASRLDQLLNEEPFSYELQIRRHAPVNITGDRSDKPRPIQIQHLLEGFRQWLPADFGEGKGDLGQLGGDRGLVKLSASDHDLGGKIMGSEFRERMMDLASRGQHVGPKELKTMEDIYRPDAISHSLLNACSPQSPAGVKLAGEQDIILQPDGPDEKPHTKLSAVSFLRDPVKSFDFFDPTLLQSSGAFAHNHARPSSLSPQLVLSKYVQSPQILITPLEAFQNTTQRLPWAQKTISKIFWRGSTTGDFHLKREDGYDWRESHRIRLHAATNARRGKRDVLVEVEGKGGEREVEMRRYEVRDLNERMMDVGLSSIGQCNEEDGTCATMRKEIQLAGVVFPHDALLYRYAFDIDGNGWSSRFRRLMAGGNVVLKMTVFPEWNTEWLTPWLHYIPVKVDLSDLYHSATFFIGTPDGEGKDAHEELGEEISKAAVEFAERHWRWEDMQGYMFRLLLEYRRAMAHDRDAMSMGGKMII